MAVYLGKEMERKEVIKTVREIEYIRCDNCGKKILPDRYKRDNDYVHVHTWHNDWGNDSCESHEHRDYCKECATKIIAKYISDMNGSEELEVTHKYLFPQIIILNYDDKYYYLAEEDKD